MAGEPLSYWDFVKAAALRPVKTRVATTELFGKNDHVAKVGLSYKRDALNLLKIPGARESDPNAMT